MPKVYLLPSPLYTVATDMFLQQLSTKTIELKKAKKSTLSYQDYYLFYNKSDELVDWWLSYTGVRKVENYCV